MCRFVELRSKEIIDIGTGARLGFVCDVTFDLVGGRIDAIIVPAKRGFWNLFAKETEEIIPWEAIKRIGEDIILVDTATAYLTQHP